MDVVLQNRPVDDAAAWTPFVRPTASPSEAIVLLNQLIDAAGDLDDVVIRRVVTACVGSITVSWQNSSLPSESSVAALEVQVRALGACCGLQVFFRRH